MVLFLKGSLIIILLNNLKLSYHFLAFTFVATRATSTNLLQSKTITQNIKYIH